MSAASSDGKHRWERIQSWSANLHDVLPTGSGRSECSQESAKPGCRRNAGQICLQLVLAFLIGVSLRLVLFPEVLLAEERSPNKVDFLIYFGVSKAASDLVGGILADVWGRRRTSMLGWGIGVAIAPILLASFNLNSIVFLNAANVLTGMMQGITWGLNITCLMDLLGPQGRGLASALSNAVGYFGSALTAPIVAQAVAMYGTPQVCISSLALSTAVGFLICFQIKDTTSWNTSSEKGVQKHAIRTGCATETQILCSLAGHTVNAATALVWGAAVLWMTGIGGVSISSVGFCEGWFTACKVVAMLISGCASGYIMPQAVASVSLSILTCGLCCLSWQASEPPAEWHILMASTALVGTGIGGAFPALAASVTEGLSDHSRASIYGAYRMWRDLGYAGGGLATRLNSGGFESTSLYVSIWSTGVALIFLFRLVLLPHCRPCARYICVETSSSSNDDESGFSD